jgi:hypothetical protein
LLIQQFHCAGTGVIEYDRNFIVDSLLRLLAKRTRLVHFTTKKWIVFR